MLFMGLDMAISQGGNVFLHEKKKKGKREKKQLPLMRFHLLVE